MQGPQPQRSSSFSLPNSNANSVQGSPALPTLASPSALLSRRSLTNFALSSQLREGSVSNFRDYKELGSPLARSPTSALLSPMDMSSPTLPSSSYLFSESGMDLKNSLAGNISSAARRNSIVSISSSLFGGDDKFLNKHGDDAPSFVGTPDYLAPESILGIGQDASVDWVINLLACF